MFMNNFEFPRQEKKERNVEEHLKHLQGNKSK